MNILNQLAKVYLENRIGLIPDSNIVSWAMDNYSIDNSTPKNESLLKIATLLTNTVDTVKAPAMARALLSEYEFDFEGQKEYLGQQLFIEYSNRVLIGTISLHQYCRLISALDAEFNVPIWIGNLYNHCDWIEPSKILDQATKKEILNTLGKLKLPL